MEKKNQKSSIQARSAQCTAKQETKKKKHTGNKARRE